MSQTVDGVIVFAGGGTGGHLYPGIAVAEEIRARAGLAGRVTKCMFVCSDRPLDAEILGKAGEEFIASPAKPLAMRPRGLARFLRTWGRAVRDARAVLRSAKQHAGDERVVVVAMGGFVAAPVAQAARVEKVPVVLVNLDAVPGKANRLVAWLAQRATFGSVVTTIPVKGPVGASWPTVGPIVREAARATGGQRACRERLALHADVPVLMVTGGSQGAKSINTMMTALAASERELFSGWQVLHQCGKGEVDAVRNGYIESGMSASRVMVREFSDRMGDWWGAADVAVSRAGAGSVAEAWANRVATVFLPYPFHKDEHQRWNAEPLERAGAALLAKDHVDAAKNVKAGGELIARLMRDDAARESMQEALGRLGPSDGAAEVASRVMEIAGRG